MIDTEKKIRDLELRIKKIEARPGAMKTPGVLNALKKQLERLKGV